MKDSEVTNWNEWLFGGPYTHEDHGTAEFRAYVYSRVHGSDSRAFQGDLEYSWDIDLDVILAERMDDPDLRMTRIFNYYVQKLGEKETFASWYDYHTGRKPTYITQDKLFSVKTDTVRVNLITKRLQQAHDSHASGKPTPADERLVDYLVGAIHKLAANPAAVFEVNGYSGQFEEPYEGLWSLWLLWHFAQGGNGRYLELPFVQKGNPYPYDFAYSWRDYVRKRGFVDELVVIGYILKICEDAVERTIMGNKKKNAQITANAQRKLEDGEFPINGCDEVVGQSPYGYEHHMPFHTGYTNIFVFDTYDGTFAAFLDNETPSGLFPVFEWEFEWYNQVAEPHAGLSVGCNHCAEYWDWDHHSFSSSNDHTNLTDLPWIDLDDLDEKVQEEDFPIILVPDHQQQLWQDEGLYEKVARTVADLPLKDVDFLDGVVTRDDDGNLYCPNCHLKMNYGWHIDMGS